MVHRLQRNWMLRVLAIAVACLVFVPSWVHAQLRFPPGVPDSNGGVPLVLREHSSGGEGPLVVVGTTFAGSIIYDIATAAGSARWHNLQNPDSVPKSSSTALWTSILATGVPVAGGVALMGSGGEGVGAILALGGLLIGPSAGHLYAGRMGRGWRTIGIRTGLTAVSVLLAACCT